MGKTPQLFLHLIICRHMETVVIICCLPSDTPSSFIITRVQQHNFRILCAWKRVQELMLPPKHPLRNNTSVCSQNAPGSKLSAVLFALAHVQGDHQQIGYLLQYVFSSLECTNKGLYGDLEGCYVSSVLHSRCLKRGSLLWLPLSGAQSSRDLKGDQKVLTLWWLCLIRLNSSECHWHASLCWSVGSDKEHTKAAG